MTPTYPGLHDAIQAARLNEQRRRDSIVRCDRIAWPYWRALPDETRHAIEAAIPSGHVLTLNARTGVGDYTARLFWETKVVAIVEHVRTVEDGAQRALRLVGVTV